MGPSAKKIKMDPVKIMQKTGNVRNSDTEMSDTSTSAGPPPLTLLQSKPTAGTVQTPVKTYSKTQPILLNRLLDDNISVINISKGLQSSFGTACDSTSGQDVGRKDGVGKSVTDLASNDGAESILFSMLVDEDAGGVSTTALGGNAPTTSDSTRNKEQDVIETDQAVRKY